MPNETSGVNLNEALVVIANFSININKYDEFIELATQHSQRSLSKCAGCLRYDIVIASKENIIFYEIYDSAESYNEHLTSDHLALFRKLREQCVNSHSAFCGPLTKL